MSKDPNNRALGPEHNKYYIISALKPCYLGPWTLRDKHTVEQDLLDCMQQRRLPEQQH